MGIITDEQFLEIQGILGCKFRRWQREFINGTLERLPYLKEGIDLSTVYTVKTILDVDKSPLELQGNIYSEDLIYTRKLLKSIVPVRKLTFKGEPYDQ